MTAVLILAGGTSDERDVSLRSGAAVQSALQAKYSVTMLDPLKPIETYADTLGAADVIFPALHGTGGEDGVIQQYFEAHDFKFVGSGSAASKLCFDKYAYGQLLAENRFLLPTTELITYEQYLGSPLYTRPHVVKPNDGGSSIDTYIVREPSPATAAPREAFERHGTMLLQALIEGIELTVGVVGSSALPVIEIIPPTDKEFDYENKYNGATQELCPPPHISSDKQTEAQDLAARIHSLTGCQDMSRTDMILAADGSLYILETNTIPGLTNQSLLPKAAATAGISMAQLCSQLVEAALTR